MERVPRWIFKKLTNPPIAVKKLAVPLFFAFLTPQNLSVPFLLPLFLPSQNLGVPF